MIIRYLYRNIFTKPKPRYKPNPLILYLERRKDKTKRDDIFVKFTVLWLLMSDSKNILYKMNRGLNKISDINNKLLISINNI